MGNLRIDIPNFIAVSLIAFIGVSLINRGLAMAGLSQYQA